MDAGRARAAGIIAGVSERNLELTRRAYEAFLKGDLDAVVEFSAPDVVVEQPRDMPDARTYQAMRASARR